MLLVFSQLSVPKASLIERHLMSKKVIVLGSTGSIGTQTLDVARQHPDKLSVVGLSCGRRVAEMEQQAVQFGIKDTAVGVEESLRLIESVDADIVVNALVGAAGLRASYQTLKAGKTLALANKESLVVGGDLIMPLALRPGQLMPIDSEHGAIYQCLLGEDAREVRRLWVTASGGPFRGWTRDELRSVTKERALAHPTWNMGPKITIDSSTLMNKGLEVIEAHHLFAMPYERIEVVVQPQSAIHSMVEFSDGSVKAHMGTTDMRIPIQFALSYPERWDAPVEPLDFRKLGSLEFAEPDVEMFRCLALARQAGETGGTLPCAMNAANEVAVAAFLAEQCAFLDIPACVESVMEQTAVEQVESIEQLVEVDAKAREAAEAFLKR